MLLGGGRVVMAGRSFAMYKIGGSFGAGAFAKKWILAEERKVGGVAGGEGVR